MPVTAVNVALLFLYLSPTALVVAIPMGLSTGVLAACGRPSDACRIRVAVVLLVIVATVVACTLFLWLAPITSRAYRELAAPAGGELRVNLPGSVGYRLAQHEGSALLCASTVLAAFGLSAAAAAAPRRRWVRLGAGIASVGYPFLYVPVAVLAFSGVVPAALACGCPTSSSRSRRSCWSDGTESASIRRTQKASALVTNRCGDRDCVAAGTVRNAPKVTCGPTRTSICSPFGRE
jgi:hypothetical protein